MITTSKINNINTDQIKTFNDDKKISIALMAFYVILMIQYFILIFFNLETNVTSASRIQLISKILVGVLFLYALPIVWKRSKVNFIVSYCIGVSLFSLHYLIFPENSIYIRDIIFPFFFMCLPAFVYSASLVDWNVLKIIMKRASHIVFMFGLILGILVFTGKISVGVYSMPLSYYMLLPAVIYLDELFSKPSLKDLILVIISFLIILALGSRGAILCIGMFIFLKIIRLDLKQNLTTSLFNLLLIGSTILIILYFGSILEYINNILLNFGIRSRSIYLFLGKDIHLGGRDLVYQNIIKGILDKPYIGMGLAGDRRINGGGYAHNLLLEILADYGIVLGTILIVSLVFLIVKYLFIKDKEIYNMYIIWLSLGFVHFMVSGSYLIDLRFWILMGLIANLSIGEKNKTNMIWPKKG